MEEETVPDEDNPMLLRRHKADSTEVKDEIRSSLFPELPENYLKERGIDIGIGGKNIFEKYASAKIKPFIFSKDLNNSEDEPDKEKPKMAYGIGLKFSF